MEQTVTFLHSIDEEVTYAPDPIVGLVRALHLDRDGTKYAWVEYITDSREIKNGYWREEDIVRGDGSPGAKLASPGPSEIAP